MARGPFQGTFQPNLRPTVATAPDAIVHINGEAEIAGCPQCNRSFDLNKYITSIQTDLSVDSVPGSANISLSVPRHSIDDFYFDGTPVITAMMEVEIFAKGYYLVEGLPQYYPIFWGLVTEVSDNYSGGEHTVSIHCADILKWWELCKTNINPAAIGVTGDQGRNLKGNVFASKSAYDIIFTLASQSFGDVLIGTGSVQNFIRDTAETNRALTDMTLYWEKRFSKMRSNLVLYGTTGVAVRGDTLFQGYSKQPSAYEFIASTAIQNANGIDGGQMFFDPANVTPFKTDYNNAGPGGLTQAEYQTKLEIAVAAKESIGFEFFMDVTGDIVFKPPFYNLDVLGNKPMSWIQDIDVIDWDFSESESEVVTQIVMQGEINSNVEVPLPPEVKPVTTVTDYHLLRKYGWRTQNYNAEFLTNPVELFYHGLDVLDRLNSKRHRGNVSIPMRPELRLGFPIYLAPKDQIWYVSGISHSINFGGRASTTLQLTSRRSKFIAPRGIGTLQLTSFGGEKVEASNKDGMPSTARYSSRQLAAHGVFELNRTNALNIPGDEAAFAAAGVDSPASPLILRHPKTGRIVGYPNVTMVYSRPFAVSDVQKVVGQQTNEEAMSRIPKALQDEARRNRKVYEEKQQAQLTPGKDSVVQGKYLHNTYQYGVNAAGVFIYAHDVSGVIREALTLDTANVKPEANSEVKQANPQTFIRPVSDERGFEVIGHYQYGRRLSLRDGRLIVNNPLDKTKIDLQLALSGDLGSLMTSQSQGLTTISTGYADPASELATLTPDDTQTAAAFPGAENSPNKRTPVFTDVGDEFIDDAPLSSQENRGVTRSVEATQLSRAVTLAEMAVLEGAMVAKEDCVCLTGRADLAFMASDYQVEVLDGSSPDYGSLADRIGTGSDAAAKVKGFENDATQLQVELDAAFDAFMDPANLGESQEQVFARLDHQAEIRGRLRAAQEARQEAFQKMLDETGGPIQVMSTSALEKQVGSIDAAIAELSKQATDLEQQQLNAESGAAVEAKVKAVSATIEAAKAQIEQIEEAALHAQPSEQQGFDERLAEATGILRSAEQELQNLKKARTPEALQAMVNDAAERLRTLQKQRAGVQADVDAVRLQRTGSIFTMTSSEVVSRVESFLGKLYETLDGAHQQFEKAIRGDLMTATNSTFKDIHQEGVSVAKQRAGNPNGPDLAPVSEFAPPFSAPERFRLGDPNAAIGSVQSNAKEISSAWSGFSQSLQTDSKNRALSTEVSQDRASIARLTSARDLLIKQRDSSTVVVGDVQKQIDSMTTQISKLEQKLANNQAKLSAVK